MVSALALLLARMMPLYRPAAGMTYGRIIASMAALPPAHAGAVLRGDGLGGGACALVPLVALTVLLDASVQTSQVVSRRTVFGTPPATRARVNALYMTSTFVGGALGSLLGTVTFHGGGWRATAGTGVAIGAVLLVLFALERRTGQAG